MYNACAHSLILFLCRIIIKFNSFTYNCSVFNTIRGRYFTYCIVSVLSYINHTWRGFFLDFFFHWSTCLFLCLTKLFVITKTLWVLVLQFLGQTWQCSWLIPRLCAQGTHIWCQEQTQVTFMQGKYGTLYILYLCPNSVFSFYFLDILWKSLKFGQLESASTELNAYVLHAADSNLFPLQHSPRNSTRYCPRCLWVCCEPSH